MVWIRRTIFVFVVIFITIIAVMRWLLVLLLFLLLQLFLWSLLLFNFIFILLFYSKCNSTNNCKHALLHAFHTRVGFSGVILPRYFYFRSYWLLLNTCYVMQFNEIQYNSSCRYHYVDYVGFVYLDSCTVCNYIFYADTVDVHI